MSGPVRLAWRQNLTGYDLPFFFQGSHVQRAEGTPLLSAAARRGKMQKVAIRPRRPRAMSTIIKADANGAVTLPVDLCQAAGVAPGAELVAEVQDGQIIL